MTPSPRPTVTRPSELSIIAAAHSTEQHKGEVIDGSGRALRLEPIRPSIGSMSMISMGSSAGSRSSLELGGSGIHEKPHASADEIRALLQRTNTALEKIVKIRESMEPLVDFSQFKKSTSRRSRMSSGFSDIPIADGSGSRTNLGDSYHSTASDDPLGGRSTGSTESTSSNDEDDSLLSSSDHSQLISSFGTPHELDDLREVNEEEYEEEPKKKSAPKVEEEDDDDDDNLSLSSMDDLSQFKEERLERMRGITVEFHEGLPAEFFQAVARFLHTSLEVKTRHSRFNFYKEAFVGNDAVRAMVLSGFAQDQPTALRYGNVLVKLGYIEHVSRTDDQLHNNKENFYRFTRMLEYDDEERLSDPAARVSINAANYRESVLMRETVTNVEYDFTEASNEVHALATEESLQSIARVLHKAFERKNKLLFYKGFVGCFLGAEAVNVIRELRIGTSLIDAVFIGQAMLDEKIIEPIATNVTTFQDKYVFYRLTQVRS
ncbi:hypothetical protein Poli38472_006585 [Pythium oligandrum]|uniref:DEP domain-containing protein n=1 Tax=Pythium oligandrum TaxID=41045 RepID=A0A8K1C524_PYTOL|nr:hypothetical protein Poli38472_006585 [Pythium oligandrum]|eukprot:TMW56575.1 hypothetical protein Poli38472_006585 [Pythium oligandrum]